MVLHPKEDYYKNMKTKGIFKYVETSGQSYSNHFISIYIFFSIVLKVNLRESENNKT